MNLRQCAFSVLWGLTVMTVIGCYSHYPSSVYGPGGPAGAYGVPPGGAYSVPGSPPTAVAPGTIYESQSPSDDSRWQPGGGDAPPYEPADNGANLVPDYRDTTGSGGGPAPGLTNGEYDDTHEFGTSAPKASPRPKAPNPMGATEPGGGNSSPFGEAASDPDEPPPADVEVSLTPVSTVQKVAEYPVSIDVRSPYKYDRESFRWLRGVVDYDEDAATWNIIYNLEPESHDRFGGSIVLLQRDETDANAWRSLRDGDVVLVEGGVEPEQLDRSGKPTFRADTLHRLEPQE